MKAVVMAGGEGSRLRPLTLNRPKPMIPLVNRVVAAHIIDLLRQHEFTDVIATLQYRAEDIQNYFGEGHGFGVNLRYSVEPHPLGTAGSVRYAGSQFDSLGDEPFLVISGDALTDFDLRELVAFHKRVGALATLTLTHVSNPLEYGVITLEKDGRIQAFIEKPSWGQVISDTVNTGIYVLSPKILDEIEPDVPFDFSRDLFPKLLARGAPLYGYVADGYWTDVGTFEEYHKASADILQGKVDVGKLGYQYRPGIYVQDDVEIASDAELYPPIFIGSGSRIRSEVVIHGPAVIQPNVIVDNRAHLDRSIVWQNVYIGQAAELRGAIIGARASIGARAVLFEGAVLGEQVTVGEGAVIHPNVKVWPQKRVEAGATMRSSLIWGSQARRTLFGRYGVTGLVNVDLTPEFAARLGAAFGATLAKKQEVIINRDPHRSPRMIKRAIIAGLPSAGVDVIDIKTAPIPVARYFTRVMNAGGGVHVRLSPYDPRTVDIRFFSHDGLNLSKSTERAVENIFFREDFRRVYLDEIGRIEDAPGAAEKTYSDDFFKTLNAHAISDAEFQIVVDYANGPASTVLPSLLTRLHVDVIALNERLDETKISLEQQEFQRALDRLGAITTAVGAHLGVRIDVGGERIWLVDHKGNKLSGGMAAAALTDLLLRDDKLQRGAIAFPVNLPNLFEPLAKKYNTRVMRVKNDHQTLMEAAQLSDVRLAFSGAGDFIFPSFQPTMDGMLALVKLLELLAVHQTSLHQVVHGLPGFHMAQRHVYCAWENKGGVLRRLNEQYHDRLLSSADGVKVALNPTEWVLIAPDPDGPFFHVHAEGNSRESANANADRYARIVEGMRT
ncbi:MAG: NTP transferase domain-containing protein [Anaerolineae bacterium]|nr:NTP transferase domain-containing protein [Anaerolineae bacterium]